MDNIEKQRENDLKGEMMSEIMEDLESGAFDSMWMGNGDEIRNLTDQGSSQQTQDKSTINDIGGSGADDTVAGAVDAVVAMDTIEIDDDKKSKEPPQQRVVINEAQINQDDVRLKRLKYFDTDPEFIESQLDEIEDYDFGVPNIKEKDIVENVKLVVESESINKTDNNEQLITEDDYVDCETKEFDIDTPMNDALNEIVTEDNEKKIAAEYKELFKTFEFDLVPNDKEFACGLCKLVFAVIGDGVILQECLHIYCRDCLKKLLFRFAAVQCPNENCDGMVLAREKRALLTPQEFNLCPMVHTPYDEYLDYYEKHRIISNIDTFECIICFNECEPYDGISLRDCSHHFCLECIRNVVIKCETVVVECPYVDEDNKKCIGQIEEREIIGILEEDDIQKYKNRVSKLNLQSVQGYKQCCKNNCEGYGIVEEEVSSFICNVCCSENCLSCKATHPNMTCIQYKQSIDGNVKLSNLYLQQRKLGGLAMDCPSCGAIVERIEGCEGMQCTICKKDLCWATKGLRWGPNGKGDTSGGCRCTPYKRCHSTCTNCH